MRKRTHLTPNLHAVGTHGYRVSFQRAGMEQDYEIALDGNRALKIGLLMLARLDDLRDGDCIICVETR